MDREPSPRRLEAAPPQEIPSLSVSRARLCNFTPNDHDPDQIEEQCGLIEPRLLLELVAQFAPPERLHLEFSQTPRAWRFDIEAQRLPGADANAKLALAATLRVIAPTAQFKSVEAASLRETTLARLEPRATVLTGECSTRVWLPPLPHAPPNLAAALDAARTLGVTRLTFVLRSLQLSTADHATLDAARFRSQAQAAQSTKDRACTEAVSLWLEAGRGVAFDIELGSHEPVSNNALNTITAALFGRAGRDDFGAPQLDLRLAVPAGALPKFRFWPTANDLALYAEPAREVVDGPGSVTIGVDAAGDAIRLSSADREMHAAVWGGSGAGKTTYLTNCMMEDIAKGEGVLLLDIHGDMADRVVALLPDHRKRDLILFDASDEALAWRLDLLTTPGVNPPLEHSRLTNMFISFFRQQYAAVPESMGPAFEQYFSNTFKLLLSARAEEDRSLLKFDDVLLDRIFRIKLLRDCADPKVRQFWEDSAEQVTGENQLDNIAPYITNKMAQFSQNPLTAAAISGNKPRLDLRAAMDERKIVIVRLPKGLIGEYDARFLGALFLMALTEAAMSRASIAETARVPFRVYIDEFADLATASAARMLAECRKYKLSLMLANQSLSQLSGDKFNPASVGQAMLANCGTFVLFRLGLGDAIALTAAIDGVSARELTQLGVGDIIARRLVYGVPQMAERLRGLPPAADPVANANANDNA